MKQDGVVFSHRLAIQILGESQLQVFQDRLLSGSGRTL